MSYILKDKTIVMFTFYRTNLFLDYKTITLKLPLDIITLHWDWKLDPCINKLQELTALSQLMEQIFVFCIPKRLYIITKISDLCWFRKCFKIFSYQKPIKNVVSTVIIQGLK